MGGKKERQVDERMNMNKAHTYLTSYTGFLYSTQKGYNVGMYIFD